MSDAALSKRSKSTSARDLRYGRRGGGWLPLQSDFEQDAAFKASVAKGEVAAVSCSCTRWWLAPRDVGTRCIACDEPMVRRVVVLDDRGCVDDDCQACHSGWTYAGSAIGACVVCDQPCRSRDPEGRAVHPSCAAGEGEG